MGMVAPTALIVGVIVVLLGGVHGAIDASAVAEAGFDADALAGVVSTVEDDALYGCVSVMKDGEMILNHAWDNSGYSESAEVSSLDEIPLRVNSVSKSVASALIGVALLRGDILSLDEPAAAYVDAWANTPSENVTIRQLLTMTSGRYYSLTADYIWPNIIGGRSLREAESVDGLFSYSEYSTFLPQETPPGTEWVYNNAGVQVLEVILSEATGYYNIDEYAKTFLYDPLGMNHTRYSLDLVGKPILAGGLRTTCEDISIFAKMYLREGAGPDGTQIIPADFVELTAAGPATDLNGAYSYLWWRPNKNEADSTPLPWVGAERTFVNSPSNECVVEYVRSGTDTKVLPDLPADAFVAAGNQGYCVIVVPSQNLIISKLSGEAGTPMLNACNTIYKRITSATTTAIEAQNSSSKSVGSSEDPCALDEPNEILASISEDYCLPENTVCNPITSNLFRRFRTPSCCAGLACQLTTTGDFGCHLDASA